MFLLGDLLRYSGSDTDMFLMVLKVLENEKILTASVKVVENGTKNNMVEWKLSDGRTVFINHRTFHEIDSALLEKAEVTLASPASAHKEVFVQHRIFVDNQIKQREALREEKKAKRIEKKRRKIERKRQENIARKIKNEERRKAKQQEVEKIKALADRYEIASINNDTKTMENIKNELGFAPIKGGIKGRSCNSNGSKESYHKPYVGGSFSPK